MWSMCHHTPPLPYARHPRPAPHAHTPTHTHARDTRTTTHARDTHRRAHARTQRASHHMPPTERHREQRTAHPSADDAHKNTNTNKEHTRQ